MSKAASLLKALLPQEGRFQELLARDTANLVRGVRIFGEIAHSTDIELRRVRSVELKAIEHEGDMITKEVYDALNRTFVTPFDREDIRGLAASIDDILDDAEAVAQLLAILELRESPDGMRQFAQILTAMVEKIDEAMGAIWDMAHARKVEACIVAISELENQGDTLYSTVLASLFNSTSRSAIEIMKWKEIYDGLEAACDKAKDFAHVLGNLLAKNS